MVDLSAYRRILEDHRPYVVATAPVRGVLDFEPLGVPVDPSLRFDPTRVASEPFLSALAKLDELTYGPLGMTLPRWAFYDCAEAVGAIVGLSVESSRAGRQLAHLFEGQSSHALPVSMMIAVPTLQPGHWLAHSLCSLNEVAPGVSPPGAALLTAALAFRAIGAARVTVTTQWSSPKVAIHACFAPLRLRAAWIPAHDEPRSAVLDFACDEERIRTALSMPEGSPGDEWLDVLDPDALRAMQARIEAGAQVDLVAPPRVRPARIEVPLGVVAAHPEAKR